MTDVWHGPYRTRDPDRLDITRAGCDRLIAAGKDAPGIFLAPSARLVFPTLRRMESARTEAAREEVWQEYRPAYIAEVRANIARDRRPLDDLLGLDRVVVCCFCADFRRCHRSLAAEILAEHGATYRGEIEHA